MLERLMRLIVELITTLVMLSFAVGLLSGTLRGCGAVVVTAAHHALLRVIGDVLATLITGLLVVGLAVRLGRLISTRPGQAGRERAALVRQERLAVRRPALDVPVVSTGESPRADPDPALVLEEE